LVRPEDPQRARRAPRGSRIGLSTIYRWLHRRFTTAAVGVQRHKKHQALVTANGPREVVEHNTVDLGGKGAGIYAYTAIDIFTKEPCVYIAGDLEMATGARAFACQKRFYGPMGTHQSDNGSEFQAPVRRGRPGQRAQFRGYYECEPEAATIALARVTAKSHLG
jgi:hypothetical protein